MKYGKIVFILGDVHGDFAGLNTFINKKIRNSKALRKIAQEWQEKGYKFEIVIMQCGDFAYFWSGYGAKGLIKNQISFLSSGYVLIYWCGGNHEDWDQLDALFKTNPAADKTGIIEIDNSIYFCRFGATLQLMPDITVLFAGGAESSDKEWRIREMLKDPTCPKIWFKQEGISESDLDRLDNVEKADWVISHTAPTAFHINLPKSTFDGHLIESSREKLEYVRERYHPKRWYFGHFHHNQTGFTDGCQWQCLTYNESGEKFWETVYLESEEIL